MVLFLVVVTLVVAFWLNYDSRRQYLDGYRGARLYVGGFAFAVFVGFMVSILATMLVVWMTASEHPVKSDLRALSDTSSVNGSFFLGSGSIDEEPVFFYYKEASPDAFVLDYVHASQATIIESDSKPHMVTYCDDFGADWVWFPFDGPDGLDCHGRSDVEFYVPRGSVTNQYNLDLER